MAPKKQGNCMRCPPLWRPQCSHQPNLDDLRKCQRNATIGTSKEDEKDGLIKDFWLDFVDTDAVHEFKKTQDTQGALDFLNDAITAYVEMTESIKTGGARSTLVFSKQDLEDALTVALPTIQASAGAKNKGKGKAESSTDASTDTDAKGKPSGGLVDDLVSALEGGLRVDGSKASDLSSGEALAQHPDDESQAKSTGKGPHGKTHPKGPKGICLRCPRRLVLDYHHGAALSGLRKCQRDIGISLTDSSLGDFWPDVPLDEKANTEFSEDDPDFAKEFLEDVSTQLANRQGENLTCTKRDMEAAARIAYPALPPLPEPTLPDEGVDTPPSSKEQPDRWRAPPSTAPPHQPDGPHFASENEECTDQPVARDNAMSLAGRLADVWYEKQQAAGNNLHSSRLGLTPNQKHKLETQMVGKYGLRTTFAVEGDFSHVKANYLKIKFPDKLYVYDVDMIRAYDTNGNAIRVMKQWDKIEILETLTSPTSTQGAALWATRRFWVTDGSMIWSTVGIIQQTSPTTNPAPLGPLTYENELGVLLNIQSINVTYRRELDLRRDVAELFFDTTSASFNESVPGLVTRGLNAFFSRHVKHQLSVPPTVGRSPYFCIGSSKSFHRNAQSTSLAASGVCSRPGFSLSVRPGIDQMFVNLTKATSPFFEPVTVQQFINREISSRRIEEISKSLKGVRIRINYDTRNTNATFPNRNSRFRFIKEVGRLVSQETRISETKWPNAQSVGHWYDDAHSPYRGHADYPNPPLHGQNQQYAINVGKSADTTPKETEWYPAGVVQIQAGQPFPGRLLPRQTDRMIQRAMLSPTDHEDILLGTGVGGGIHHYGFADTQQSGLQDVQMSAETDFVTVQGRFIKIPDFRFHGGSTPKDLQPGTWNLRGMGFVTSGFMNNLPVLNLSEEDIRPGWYKFLSALKNHRVIARSVNDADIRDSRPHITSYTADTQFEDDLAKEFRQLPRFRPQLPGRVVVLVVLPEKDQDMYAAIKRVADVRLGVRTICVTVKNLCRDDFTTFGNIALKYCIKQQGYPHSLMTNLHRLTNPPCHVVANTIVIGADVTHPNDGSRPAAPSIAGVVGSVDDTFMRFPGSMRLQQGKKEDIVDLVGMVCERLLAWADIHCDALPDNVLFYRDGVSESQYDIIRRRELPQIQLAVNRARAILDRNTLPREPPLPQAKDPKYGSLSKEDRIRELREDEELWADKIEFQTNNTPIKLTFVVVGKRHNTRFYATKEEDMINSQPVKENDLNLNVKPGLAVDQVITHPYNMDFYLQSHVPLKGTGRSAHYYVLRNDMEMNMAELQDITHTFCYAYARATKAVSYCAPAYYADRLCDRGRAYLRHEYIRGNDDPARPTKTRAESWEDYCDRVIQYIQNSTEYNPHGTPNPWHANLNDIMFYL